MVGINVSGSFEKFTVDEKHVFSDFLQLLIQQSMVGADRVFIVHT